MIPFLPLATSVLAILSDEDSEDSLEEAFHRAVLAHSGAPLWDQIVEGDVDKVLDALTEALIAFWNSQSQGLYKLDKFGPILDTDAPQTFPAFTLLGAWVDAVTNDGEYAAAVVERLICHLDDDLQSASSLEEVQQKIASMSPLLDVVWYVVNARKRPVQTEDLAYFNTWGRRAERGLSFKAPSFGFGPGPSEHEAAAFERHGMYILAWDAEGRRLVTVGGRFEDARRCWITTNPSGKA